MSSSPLYETLRSPRLPHSDDYDTYPRDSTDSDDSLRALELSEGPLLAEAPRTSRGRSYSVSGFDFQNDLLPLTASLSEPENVRVEAREKHIGLVNGMWTTLGGTRHAHSVEGIALCVGLQVQFTLRRARLQH